MFPIVIFKLHFLHTRVSCYCSQLHKRPFLEQNKGLVYQNVPTGVFFPGILLVVCVTASVRICLPQDHLPSCRHRNLVAPCLLITRKHVKYPSFTTRGSIIVSTIDFLLPLKSLIRYSHVRVELIQIVDKGGMTAATQHSPGQREHASQLTEKTQDYLIRLRGPGEHANDPCHQSR